MIKDKLKKRLMKLSLRGVDEAWDVLKIRRDSLVREKAMDFRVGQRVYFINTRNGEKVSGKIIRVNQKTVSMLSDDKMNWKVSIGLLKVEK